MFQGYSVRHLHYYKYQKDFEWAGLNLVWVFSSALDWYQCCLSIPSTASIYFSISQFCATHLWLCKAADTSFCPHPPAPPGEYWGIPKPDGKCNSSSVYLGLSRNLLPLGYALNISRVESRKYPSQISRSPQLGPLDMKKQWLSKLFLLSELLFLSVRVNPDTWLLFSYTVSTVSVKWQVILTNRDVLIYQYVGNE